MNMRTESREDLHPTPLIPAKPQLWRECDVNKLVEHFHRYDKNNKRVERLDVLSLSQEKIGRLFPLLEDEKGNKIEISSFDISFGLDERISPTDQFTFRPAIAVTYANGYQAYEDFDYGKPKDTKENGSDVVPPPFKDWLSKNWMELDVSLVDDIFGALVPKAAEKHQLVPPKRASERLLGYHFSPTANNEFRKFINDHLGSIFQFFFHLGVDMNKFGHKEEFSFSPVFEVRVPDPPDDVIVRLHRYGLKSVPIIGKKGEVLEESVLYEYISPCPSSCP